MSYKTIMSVTLVFGAVALGVNTLVLLVAVRAWRTSKRVEDLLTMDEQEFYDGEFDDIVRENGLDL